MCVGDECGGGAVSRRSFVVGAPAAIAGIATGAEGQQAQQPPTPALSSPDLVQGTISFKCGGDTIPGYLARPKKAGRYRTVVVLHGNFGMPDLARYTCAFLAQNGIAALAFTRFSRFPGLTVQDLVKSDQTDRRFLSKAFNEQELVEALAALNYLTSQPYAKPGSAGMLGYCGGGTQALWLSTLTRQVKAIVAFHALTVSSGPIFDRYNSPSDPKTGIMAMIDQIKAPVQGHVGTADSTIPLADAEQFEQALRRQGTKVEMYTYEGADHAFGDFTRPRLYKPEAAILAWQRSAKFLRDHL